MNRMNQVIHFVTSNWGNRMAVQWISNIMVSVHVGLGVGVLAGGEARFDPPTYQPLIDLSHGHTWVWGIWILISSVLMMMPNRWPQILGLWSGMVWQIMWCSLFAVAIVQYPEAGATYAVAHGGFALIDAALLTARIVDRGEE